MGVSGQIVANNILGFTCLVMPWNEMKLSTTSEDGENNVNFRLLVILY